MWSFTAKSVQWGVLTGCFYTTAHLQRYGSSFEAASRSMGGDPEAFREKQIFQQSPLIMLFWDQATWHHFSSLLGPVASANISLRWLENGSGLHNWPCKAKAAQGIISTVLTFTLLILQGGPICKWACKQSCVPRCFYQSHMFLGSWSIHMNQHLDRPGLAMYRILFISHCRKDVSYCTDWLNNNVKRLYIQLWGQVIHLGTLSLSRFLYSKN